MNNAEVIASSKTVTIHSLQLKQPLASFTHHRGIINAATINHNNKVIATCGQDGKIFLVNSEKPENKLFQNNFYPNPKDKIYSLNACAFSPTSKYLAVGSIDSLVKIWDLRGQKNSQKDPPHAIKSHMGGVTSLAWIKYLKGQIYGPQILASSSSSGDIFIHSNKGGSFNQIQAMKMQEGVNCIRVSQGSDYCRMAACTNGGALAQDMGFGEWKSKAIVVDSLEQRTKTVNKFVGIFSLQSGSVGDCFFGQQLSFLRYSIKKVYIFQLMSVKTIPTEQALTCVGLHSNGHTLVAGGMFGNILAYDLRSPNKPINKLTGHQTSIKHLQFYRTREKQRQTLPIGQPKNIKTSSFTTPQSNIASNNRTTLPLQNKNNNTNEDIKAKDIPKISDPKINNFINITKPSIIREDSFNQKNIDKPITNLSNTGQQVIRNAAINKKLQTGSFNQTGGSQFFRNKSKEVIRSQSSIIAGSGETEWLKRQVKDLKTITTDLREGQSQLKEQLFNFQERVNMSMIRQFQLHQQQMSQLIENLLVRDRQKEQYIKKLQAENKRLKGSPL